MVRLLKIVVLIPEEYTQIGYPDLWTGKYFFLAYSSNE